MTREQALSRTFCFDSKRSHESDRQCNDGHSKGGGGDGDVVSGAVFQEDKNTT